MEICIIQSQTYIIEKKKGNDMVAELLSAMHALYIFSQKKNEKHNWMKKIQFMKKKIPVFRSGGIETSWNQTLRWRRRRKTQMRRIIIKLKASLIVIIIIIVVIMWKGNLQVLAPILFYAAKLLNSSL